MSDDGFTIYGGDVGGRQIGGDRPANHLGDVDSHMLATPERVKNARLFWPERPASDFAPYGSTGQRFVDDSGHVYQVCGHDPLQGPDPAKDPTEFFVQSGSWLFFMKPLGVGVAAGTGLSDATFSGRLERDWGGRPVLIDTVTGAVIDTRLIEAGR